MTQIYSVDDVIPDRMYGIFFPKTIIIGKPIKDVRKNIYFLKEMIYTRRSFNGDRRGVEEIISVLDDPNKPDGEQWHLFYNEDFIFELEESEVLNHIVANRL